MMILLSIYIYIFITFPEDSKSENCKKSSTAQGDEMFEDCCVGIFTEVCDACWFGGSDIFLSASLEQLELKATRIPVAKNLWWLAERLPGEWIGSSQSLQKSALSSTQKMKAAFSWTSYKTHSKLYATIKPEESVLGVIKKRKA